MAYIPIGKYEPVGFSFSDITSKVKSGLSFIENKSEAVQKFLKPGVPAVPGAPAYAPPPADDTIFGLPKLAVYAGGALALFLVLRKRG